jgi:hypothetical protein
MNNQQEQTDPLSVFNDKLAAIAQALSFTTKPRESDHRRGTLTDAQGRPICVTWDQHERRLIFNGDWPASKSGQAPGTMFRPRESIAIGAGFDRPADLIARDFMRRFYPKFVTAYDEALRQKHQHEQYLANKEAAIQRAAELLGRHRAAHEQSDFSIYEGSEGMYIRVESYSDTQVKLELHGPVARLEPALHALRKAIEERNT